MNPHPLLLGGAILFLIAAAAAELSVPHLTSAAIASAAGGMPEALKGDVRRLALAAVAYGCFAAMRGFLFSLLNTELVQNLQDGSFLGAGEGSTGSVRRPRRSGLCGLEAGRRLLRRGPLRLHQPQHRGPQRARCDRRSHLFGRASPEAAKACAGVGVALAAAALVYGRYSRAASRAAQDRLADAAATAEEALARATTVRALGGEGAEEARYATALARLRRVARRQSASYLAYVASNASLFNLSKAAALAAAGAVALRGELSARALTAVLLYVDATASAALSLADQWGAVMEALGAAERVLAYVDAPRAPQLEPRAVNGAGDDDAGSESESESSKSSSSGRRQQQTTRTRPSRNRPGPEAFDGGAPRRALHLPQQARGPGPGRRQPHPDQREKGGPGRRIGQREVHARAAGAEAPRPRPRPRRGSGAFERQRRQGGLRPVEVVEDGSGGAGAAAVHRHGREEHRVRVQDR